MPEPGWKVLRVRVAEGSRFSRAGADVCVVCAEGSEVVVAAVSSAEAGALGFRLALGLGLRGNEYLVVMRESG